MPKPLFTMLQISDVHLDLRADRNNTQGKWKAFVEAIGKGPLDDAPDLALLAGDIIDEPHEGAMRRFLAGLSQACPGARRLAVPGNHDAYPPDDPPAGAAFFHLAPADPRGKVEEFGGVAFILLNNADGDRPGTPWIEARNRWLAGVLERYAGQPKIIAAHVPLVPLRDAETLAAAFAFPTWVNRDGGALLGLIESHADSVIAVLGGHLHLTGRVEHAGIQHIVTSGLMSWPHDVGLYRFYRDRVDVRVVSLEECTGGIDAGDLRGFPLRNGVYDRWACPITDALHPTAADFIRGLPGERSFSIPLTGNKVPR